MAKPKKPKKPLFEKLASLNTLGKTADVLSNSKFFQEEFHDTKIPALNLALSAKLDGGFSRGSTLISGDSKTFKSMFMLVMASAYLKENPDAWFIYYDNEFGTNKGSMESVGIDTSRVYHKPIDTIENLKIDLAQLLKGLDETDDVIIGIDSLGAIASNKEVEDAEDGKTVTDMTRAKSLKSFWRIINPQLNVKNIPLIAIGQTYSTQETYSKDVIGGGKGMVYFPNNIWLVRKQVIKDTSTKEILGSFFNVNVFKGRLVKEGSVFPIEITHEKGIDKYSALLDIALKLGYVEKPKVGWFTHKGVSKNYRRKQTSTEEFWKDILNNPDFKSDVEKLYALGSLETPELIDISSIDEIVEDNPD